MKAKVAVKSCSGYELDKLEDALRESLLLLGGSSSFFKPGKSALVKPNLLTNAMPQDGITTHPNFVQAIVRVLKRIGIDVAIADIPGEHGLEANLERLYNITGMRDVAERERIRLLTETRFIEEDGIVFSNWVREFDYLVSLPKFKTHSLTTLSGAVKNIFGLTPRLYRINLHKRFAMPDDFARMLLDVFRKCKPTISFVDGIVAMEGNGPAYSGSLRKVGLIATSNDAFALDTILAYVMGLQPSDIATNREARLQNIGVTDLEDIEVMGENLKDFKTSDFKLPPGYLVSRVHGRALKFLNSLGLAKFRPKVNTSRCKGCRICIENCPVSAIELQNKKAEINYRKCLDCFCCLEVCPVGAIKTNSGPLIYALRLREQLKKLDIFGHFSCKYPKGML